ncbi:MAG TPA: M1 family peptidase, partial [Verrucomicrobiae bacterium]|nr:M1 family peptidase [Verrucomicrobiae bacterium]
MRAWSSGLVSLWLMLFAVVFSTAADQAFSFATTPGQLPKNVVPHHYAMRIEPDLQKFTTRGSMSVRIEVVKPVKQILLNAVDLKVTKATLESSSLRKSDLKVKVVPEKQLLVLKSSKEIAPGTYQLALEFSGKIIEQAEGFFYAKYSATNGDKVMLATQMEPTDARRMFPCWDEPVFRATFDLTVVLPENFKAF